MTPAKALLEISRFHSALLAAMAVFIMYFARTREVWWSMGQALPLLFTCMATFVANAIDDIERDAINHPERPLPGRHLAPQTAVVLYFVCLAAALYSTRHLVEQRTAFWYYGLIATSVSYGYLVDAFPGLKAPYVAATVVTPILMVGSVYPGDRRLLFAASAVFLTVLGKEVCMDIRDRAGDAPSFVQRLPAGPLAAFAFGVQVLAVAILASVSSRFTDLIALAVALTLLAVAGYYWFRLGKLRASIAMMRLQLVAGLAFLA